jgi:hypothetical protein
VTPVHKVQKVTPVRKDLKVFLVSDVSGMFVPEHQVRKVLTVRKVTQVHKAQQVH